MNDDYCDSLQYELDRALDEQDELRYEISALEMNLAEAQAERDALAIRRDELLSLVAKLSQEVLLDSEVKDALAQRGVLLAEVGTLRSRVTSLETANAHLHGRLDALLTRGPNFRCSVCGNTFHTWDAWFAHTCQVNDDD